MLARAASSSRWKGLGIELPGVFDDLLPGDLVASEPRRLTNLHVLEVLHAGTPIVAEGRRSYIVMPTTATTTSPRWLTISTRRRTKPMGRVFDGRVSSTSVRPASTSPGRTGRSQRQESRPGEPGCRGVLAPGRLHREAHHQGAGIPAAGDEPAEDGVPGRLRVGMKRLGIVLAGEGQDLLLRDRARAQVGGLSDLEVFPVLHASVLSPRRRAASRRRPAAKAGNQIQQSSDASTVTPRRDRNRARVIGEASITRSTSGAK